MKKNLLAILRTFVFLLPLPLCFVSCEGFDLNEIFKSGGDGDKDFVVVTPDELFFESEALADTLTVSSSGEWMISGVPSWLSVSSMSGMDGDELIVSVGKNSSADERTTLLLLRCGDALDTLSVTQYGHIDTDYVDLNLDGKGVSYSYNAATGNIDVTYSNGSVPSVDYGQAFVLPVEYGYDIRVVEGATVSGNTLKVQTSQGNMANLFRNIGFTLSTNPSASTRSVDGRRVFTPSSYGYLDAEGKYQEMYNASTRASYSVPVDLWNFDVDFGGSNIYNGDAGRLYWDKCRFDAGLNGTFTFDFGEKSIDQVRKVGDLKLFSYEMAGNISADMLLHYHYENEYSESDDQIIKYNVIPTSVFRFVVDGVPVVILVYTHLGKQHSFSVEGSLDATAGLKLGHELTVGLEWTPNGGVRPYRQANPTFDVYPLTVEAEASAEAKVSYYPQVEIGVYKFLGPWVEPRPYLKENVEAGFRASTDGENYVGWKAESYNGMDIRMGLKLDFGMFDKEVWKSDVENVIEDRLLFEAPSHIRTLSPDDATEVEKGESVTAEFIVESYCPVTAKYYPCPLALVNFDADSGDLSAEVAVADAEGKVTVEWTPAPNEASATRSGEKKDCVLTAEVVDKSGEVIGDATLTVKAEKSDLCDDANHVHAVDLGLSVKWACCNVGASVPEGYGGYYAWGETEEKSNYTPLTYKYYLGDLDGDGDYYESNEYQNIGSNISGTSYDVAHVKWGGSWRMPTLLEIEELCNKCSWEWTSVNGVSGQKVTGPNGNSIFLPAASYRYVTEVSNRGSYGYYWSGKPEYDFNSNNAHNLHFGSGGHGWHHYCYWNRDYGFSVRPVTE